MASDLETGLPDPFIQGLRVSPKPPLRIDGNAIRVGTSRVTFDLVVEQYEDGMTPEEMVRAYDTLSLPDVYAAIAHYLSHRDQARAYLARRLAEAQTHRAEIEGKRPPITREALLARRLPDEVKHASAGQ